jgi:hypothetical protein
MTLTDYFATFADRFAGVCRGLQLAIETRVTALA